MPYQIEVRRKARKALVRLRGQDQARIEAKIDALADDPRPPGCEPVKAATRGTYRVRVGDYRVIYTVLDDEQVVVVARVIRRGERTYKGLR
ncbi:MAG: type II toxin-antitoxin system RelE/ParE family toxin [Anaerolineae bacterium]|nr:type II toxin-antitoxin system RelE/ParE family toxin [Anaerolineae bacterium]